MASIVSKKRGSATYYYLVEFRPGERPAEDRLAGIPGYRRGAGRRDARRELGLPARTQHKDFGAVAAAWGMLEDLGVGIIDQVTGPRRSDAGASVGAYLALAALGRLVAPCSKLAFANWLAGAADGPVHRDQRQALDAAAGSRTRCTPSAWRNWVKSATGSRWPSSARPAWTSVALDMTNFATFLDTGNQRNATEHNLQDTNSRKINSRLRQARAGLPCCS